MKYCRCDFCKECKEEDIKLMENLKNRLKRKYFDIAVSMGSKNKLPASLWIDREFNKEGDLK